uniref:Putative regulatory protein NPR1 n=1 Tax=Rhizophora mucronata TaxID=61149 RepID=A0A2P2M097_RHIMU
MSNGSDSFDVTDLSGALNNETRAGLVNALKEGKVAPKDRLCIEILEQAERRDPLLGEASLYYAMAGDDLRMKLLYLENRGNSSCSCLYFS